ncbi:hypothetical protein HCR15_05855 [Wolbachia pipientis]|uniref:hypothetical protein n=1 Tax=Wolbachia pipientis TaxID=955 RepID=UPI0015F9A553|nr:hypothetical protein [Wolbachia pipientis]MBA8756548.1 hypothetical protein [Wolbachia pipientis]
MTAVPSPVIRVADYLDPGNLTLPSKCTIRTRFQTGMTAVLRHTEIHSRYL